MAKSLPVTELDPHQQPHGSQKYTIKQPDARVELTALHWSIKGVNVEQSNKVGLFMGGGLKNNKDGY